MQVVILCSGTQQQELANNEVLNKESVIWLTEFVAFAQHISADVFIDLLFENRSERIELLQKFLPRLVIVNSVVGTLKEINASFVRINGWTTFLSSNLIEAATLDEALKFKAEETFALFGKQIEWLPDTAGFITPRVISMIINEACFALSEGVSTKEEVDTAMKLGTAYPYGPLEWGAKIGLQNIVALLKKMSVVHNRYTPAALLVQEANKLT